MQHQKFYQIVIADEIWTRILGKTCIKMIGPEKGPCSLKTGQKVVFIEGEKGFFKNAFSKGISDPKTGLKRACT